MRDLVNTEDPIPDGIPLEDMLTGLLRFGCPRLSYLTDGWHANIKMHVSSEGATFEIRTEFNHKTPNDAVRVLIGLVRDTLKDLKKGPVSRP